MRDTNSPIETNLPDSSRPEVAADSSLWFELAKKGDKAALFQAIDERRFNPNELMNNDGYSVWHMLAINGHSVALFQAIDERRFNPNELKNNIGYSVWHILAKYGHTAALFQAINAGRFNPNELKGPFGNTVWHILAMYGHTAALFQAIDAGRFNPNELKNNFGNTVWLMLAINGHSVALFRAIDAGRFNPNELENNNGNTVWHLLARHGHTAALFRAIDERRFNPNELMNNDGYSVWHMLAINGHSVALFQAIDAGRFNPNELKDHSGNTVWHILAKYGHTAALFQAIDAGRFNPNELVNNDGNSVWHLLARHGHTAALFRAIDESKFNPDELENNDGDTVWDSLFNNEQITVRDLFKEIYSLKLNLKQCEDSIPDSNMDCISLLHAKPQDYENLINNTDNQSSTFAIIAQMLVQSGESENTVARDIFQIVLQKCFNTYFSPDSPLATIRSEQDKIAQCVLEVPHQLVMECLDKLEANVLANIISIMCDNVALKPNATSGRTLFELTALLRAKLSQEYYCISALKIFVANPSTGVDIEKWWPLELIALVRNNPDKPEAEIVGMFSSQQKFSIAEAANETAITFYYDSNIANRDNDPLSIEPPTKKARINP